MNAARIFRRHDYAWALNGWAAKAMIARAVGDFDLADMYEEWAQSDGSPPISRGRVFVGACPHEHTGTIQTSVALAAIHVAGSCVPPQPFEGYP